MKYLGINLIIWLIAFTAPASAGLKNDSVLVEQEPTLLIEDWMLEELNPHSEFEFQLEGWMFNALSESSETELSIEPWMLNELVPNEESEMPLSDWMFEPLM